MFLFGRRRVGIFNRLIVAPPTSTCCVRDVRWEYWEQCTEGYGHTSGDIFHAKNPKIHRNLLDAKRKIRKSLVAKDEDTKTFWIQDQEQKTENPFGSKDTKTFWIRKIQKPFGSKRYRNLSDQYRTSIITFIPYRFILKHH